MDGRVGEGPARRHDQASGKMDACGVFMWWWLRGCVHMSELHQIIYFKYMRFIVYQVDLSKVKKKA